MSSNTLHLLEQGHDESHTKLDIYILFQILHVNRTPEIKFIHIWEEKLVANVELVTLIVDLNMT